MVSWARTEARTPFLMSHRPAARPRYSVLAAPITLGLARADPAVVPGVQGLAAALLQAGLAAGLGAEDAGEVPAPTEYRPEREAGAGIRNASAVAAYAPRLADRVGELLADGRFPLVLGGDCSILLGAGLALRRRGRYGLFFLDGHTDFYTPASSSSGQVAAMELWLATGHGPLLLADLEGRGPLFAARDVVLFGHRDVAEQVASGALDPADFGVDSVPWSAILDDAAGLAADALARLESHGVDGLWIHVDADVLDSALMPAVDSPQPGGLSFAQLAAVLRRVMASGLAVGAEITIFDPSLDEDGRLAGRLAAALIEGFSNADGP